MNYIGEHLLYGKLGNFLIVLSFTSAILSVIAFLFASKKDNQHFNSWRTLGRSAFVLHGISIFSVAALIFYLIHGHFYEYYYVWQHSSDILPLKYMWACFWEGQEGSFLLWTFWHIVLGGIIIYKGKDWESPVMVTIMLIQVFLTSMVLGIYIGDLKIGSNPFILLRNHPDFATLPFIQMEDYLSKISRGRGLNPLLQNYWMVIHPPTLFLGFASTAIPFAFAMAGLITGRIREWVKPALPWAFFSVMILGTGILMGGAWAYEALSFGGFWAWDPVENASLVPWIIMVGAAHVMLIYKKNGSSLLASLILISLSFLLILYSTFLTRSGILGDTSVHAFTDLGMSGQLLIYMVFFILMTIVLIAKNWKAMKTKDEDDSILSREFWMFMGMLVLVISAVQITVTTSIPVLNKVFDLKMAPPADAIGFYNSWQIPLAAIICLLISIGQFFKWKDSNAKDVAKKLAFSFLISIVISIALHYYFHFERYQYLILLFTSVWAFVANADYWIRILKGNLKFSGASVSHMGIALILLGSLISNTEQKVISRNMLNVDLGKDFPNQENILLYQGDTLAMGSYYVTYTGKEKEGVNLFYTIQYFEINPETGKLEEAFVLKPIVQLNDRMGNVSEPATKKFINGDIYTHITFAEMDDKDIKKETEEGYKKPTINTIAIGDTIITSNSIITLDSISKNTDKASLFLNEDDIAVTAYLNIVDINKKQYLATPTYIIRKGQISSKEDKVDALGLLIGFVKINPEDSKFDIAIAEKKSNSREFIIMKAIIFPQINILWIGCLLMIIGTITAIIKRIRDIQKA